MTLKEPGSELDEELGGKLGSVPGLLRLLYDVRDVEGVRRIGLAMNDDDMAVWVLMDKANVAAAERIFEYEYEYLRRHLTKGALRLDLHVHGLDKIDARLLPAFEEVIEVAEPATA